MFFLFFEGLIFAFLDDHRYNVLYEETATGVRNALIIHEASSSDFGLYNCTAENEYGADILEIMLEKQSKCNWKM